jgi:GNAT superfamily N-acetyltransferase/DNA-binding transcriptional regulator YhcF (GntR family)
MKGLKLYGKDLIALGFPEGRAIGVAINVMLKHHRKQPKELVLDQLKAILKEPMSFLEHEEFSPIADALLERDRKIIGACGYEPSSVAFHPRKFRISLYVHPSWRGRGVEAQLYDHLEVELSTLKPISLMTKVREDDADLLALFSAHGFEEISRSWKSYLDVAAFDPTPFEGVRQKVTAAGITIRSLAERIIAGMMEPGTKLRQDHIAEEFGASHVPVREAFRRLEAQGLVVSEPRRGVRVAGFSLNEIREVAEMRAALEALALRNAAPHLTRAIPDQAEEANREGDRARDVRAG